MLHIPESLCIIPNDCLGQTRLQHGNHYCHPIVIRQFQLCSVRYTLAARVPGSRQEDLNLLKNFELQMKLTCLIALLVLPTICSPYLSTDPYHIIIVLFSNSSLSYPTQCCIISPLLNVIIPFPKLCSELYQKLLPRKLLPNHQLIAAPGIWYFELPSPYLTHHQQCGVMPARTSARTYGPPSWISSLSIDHAWL